MIADMNMSFIIVGLFRLIYKIYTDYYSTADTIMWLAQCQWNSPSGLNDIDITYTIIWYNRMPLLIFLVDYIPTRFLEIFYN